MKILRIFIALLACISAYASPKVTFAPDRELLKSLIELIDNEKESVRIAADHLSNRELAAALVNAKKRGVVVEVIVDRVAARPKLPVHGLAEAGIPIYVYDTPPPSSEKRAKARPHMHHKFCLFGNNKGKGKLLWTGTLSLSYKRSKANRENSMIFTDRETVSGYEQEFTEIKEKSCKRLKEFLKKP